MVGPWSTGLDPAEHVYPATVWWLATWTTLHAAVGCLMSVYVLARRAAGKMTAVYDGDIHKVVLFWRLRRHHGRDHHGRDRRIPARAVSDAVSRPLSKERESLWRLVVSPLISAAHFMASYVTAAIWCARQAERAAGLAPVRWAILGYTIMALVGIVLNGLDGWRRHRFGDKTLPQDVDTPGDRHRFLGFATALLAGLSGIATIFTALVAPFFEDCRRRAHRTCLVLGLAVLDAMGLGPLPTLDAKVSWAHMATYMGVIAVAPALLAFAIAGMRANPVCRAPTLFPPGPLPTPEPVGVWAWHAPRRTSSPVEPPSA